MGIVNELSFSLVVYKSSLLELQRLMKSMELVKVNYTFFVVDNSPSARLKEFFENHSVVYKFVGINLGFGRAHNMILREIVDRYKYHIVINPDIWFTVSGISEMIEFMDLNGNVGQLMPKVLYPNGAIQYLCKRFPRPWDLFVNRVVPRFMARKRLDHFEMREMGYSTICDVEFLSGCFMFLRVDALKQVGFFDEEMFLYFEDLDLTRRIGASFRTVFYPEVEVYHEYRRESKRNIKLFAIMIRSIIYYYNKYGWLPLT